MCTHSLRILPVTSTAAACTLTASLQTASRLSEGFSVALQHPAFSTNVRILCAAASTCRAWREAVQECSTCSTAVEVSLGAPLSRLCSFARWLPKHAALVSSITIGSPARCSGSKVVDGLQWGLHLEAAQQLLQQAMQLAAAPLAAAAWSNTAAAAQEQQPPVRLPNISSITLAGDTAMLRVLPAHSLTRLSLRWLPCSSGSAAAAALVKLSNLQQLHIQTPFSSSDPGSFLPGIAQLRQLTLLELDDVADSQVEELLQLLAQPLPLRALHINDHGELPMLDLSQLTQLQELSTSWMELDVIFPPQLQQLELGDVVSTTQVDALMALRHLRRLDIVVALAEPALLLRLAQLPALQQLILEYKYSRFAVATAAAWPQLPQLRDLRIDCNDDDDADDLPDRQQWQGIIDGVAASTKLTRLFLDVFVDPDMDTDEEDVEHVAACAKLTGLRQLQDLRINYSWCKPLVHTHMSNDALSLTALTGLTRLVLAHAGACVGDLAATAIAGSCKQLRHLDLKQCHLGSMACLANIRYLKQLTELRLEGNAGPTQQELVLLKGLKQLQTLGIDGTAEITDAVLDTFWEAVTGQMR
jgi:hypothetical protein